MRKVWSGARTMIDSHASASPGKSSPGIEMIFFDASNAKETHRIYSTRTPALCPTDLTSLLRLSWSGTVLQIELKSTYKPIDVLIAQDNELIRRLYDLLRPLWSGKSTGA